MERVEKAGLGVSLAGHVALVAALSLGLFAAKNKLPVESRPLDVQFVDEIGLKTTAPKASTEPAAESKAPEQGVPADAAPPPPEMAPPVPAPIPAPAPPKPAPAPAPGPTPARPVEQAPAKPAPAARPRLSADILKGLKPEKTTGRGGDPKSAAAAARGSRLGANFLKGIAAAGTGRSATLAAALGAQAQSSLAAAIREQLARYWVPPSGPIGGLKTALRVRLNRDGSVAGRPEVIGQTGLTDGNRGYARQHADAAIRTVYKAAPLKLPPALYDYWKLLEPLNFDATLDR